MLFHVQDQLSVEACNYIRYIQDNFIQTLGFILNRIDRISHGGGGLVTNFSEKEKFNRKAEFEISDVETMWCELKPIHKKSF